MPDPAVVAQDLVALPPAFDPRAVLGDLAAPLEAHRRALARGDLATRDWGAGARHSRRTWPPSTSGCRRRSERVDVVGCARLGDHRVVKLRLEGPERRRRAAGALGHRRRGAGGSLPSRPRRSAPDAVVLSTVLVANRGEIARRVFRACRRAGVGTVAVFSEADRDAPHVRDADAARLLGPAPARESYLDIERILDAARRTGADAVHPGYGFLSENWRFAQACRRRGSTFIGPPAEAIRAMGDKTGRASPDGRRRRADGAGEPRARRRCDAARRGGGRRDRLPADPQGGRRRRRHRHGAGRSAGGPGGARSPPPPRRAQSAFGNAAVYLERYLERPRHVEVQVFADAHGAVVHLHERECSIQRRHQKLIEESPAPGLAPRDQARPHRGGGGRRPGRRLRQRGDDGVHRRCRRPSSTSSR